MQCTARRREAASLKVCGEDVKCGVCVVVVCCPPCCKWLISRPPRKGRWGSWDWEGEMAGACGQAVCARVCVCACVRERSFFFSSTSTRPRSVFFRAAAGRCSPPTLFFFSRKFRQLEREVGHHEKRWRTLFSIVRMHSRYAPAVVQVCVWCAHYVCLSLFSLLCWLMWHLLCVCMHWESRYNIGWSGCVLCCAL